MGVRRQLSYLVVGALCATGALAIGVLLVGSFDDTSWRVLGSTTAVAVAGLLGVPAGALIERGLSTVLGRASAVVTTSAFLLTLYELWGRPSEAVDKTWAVLATIAVAGAQACAVELRRREGDTATIRGLALAATAVGSLLAALGCYAILAEVDGDAFFRALGALGVVDVVLLGVIGALRRGQGGAATVHRLRLDGRVVEPTARDFATAVLTAIREAERNGERVQRIERL